MRLAYRIANWIAAKAYSTAVRARQTPSVLAELTPRFVSDDLVTPAVGDRFAIVVKYALFGVTDDFLQLLAALRRHNVNPIVVCNGNLSDEELGKLKADAHRILVRRNRGRDFGAYRAATLFLQAQNLRPRRLLYLNDSVMFVDGPGLDAMIGALADSSYDVVGTFENHEFVHHVGTYAFSLTGDVFADPRVQRFWRHYKPYDLRPHAIQRGEIGLSECLAKCGYRTDVVYSAERLALRLDRMNLPELVEKLRYAPYGALRNYDLKALLSGATETASLLHRAADSKPVKATTPTITEYARVAARASSLIDESKRRSVTADQVVRETLVNHIMGHIINGSQIHYGFGLFHRVMDSPLIKRDLLIRGVLLEYDCARILDYMPASQRDPIMRELINRGRLVNLRGWRAFMVHNGFV
ncbi:lipopolysaccharide biosynthesis protein [Mesorhizobium hawassense]|uniref:Lipopolysaccharide biosynthesis protein n=1 Tax=Mesorhizobium hawassense TaxID=1209954 RepID=A0A330HU73_9HYPH|nr:rhamnan synthesis F family protein [Mesorhizobium hawassense]RAZ91172.1 lipopolysaccharide biosynthesis protein [Mesorhizobium hawassense]